jgi:hypothetical protein
MEGMIVCRFISQTSPNCKKMLGGIHLCYGIMWDQGNREQFGLGIHRLWGMGGHSGFVHFGMGWCLSFDLRGEQRGLIHALQFRVLKDYKEHGIIWCVFWLLKLSIGSLKYVFKYVSKDIRVIRKVRKTQHQNPPWVWSYTGWDFEISPAKKYISI